MTAPKANSSDRSRAEKAERTNVAARYAIDQERLRRDQKTARLKALRLEQEQLEPSAPDAPPARKGKARTLASRRVQSAFAQK